MGILFIMAIGIGIGIYFFPGKWMKQNECIQLASIMVLIFCMGVSLGSNPAFITDVIGLGVKSIALALLPIGGSVVVVYLLTSKYLKGKEND